MYRFLLVLTLLFAANSGFSRTMAKPLDTIDSSDQVALTADTLVDTNIAPAPDSTIAKPGKAEEDGVDKDSMGYKIGYQIGSWLIPGILMVIVSFLIFKRSQRK